MAIYVYFGVADELIPGGGNWNVFCFHPYVGKWFKIDYIIYI